MEFASTAAVVVATLFQMPVSTTHCQIGAVTAVGSSPFPLARLRSHASRVILETFSLSSRPLFLCLLALSISLLMLSHSLLFPLCVFK
eukprot:584679-Amorphochlora_amoeboformis.AAC.1